jgi:hypothetical protein
MFAQFGQNLRFSSLTNDKFAAKFPEAGNLKLGRAAPGSVLQNRLSLLPVRRTAQQNIDN